MERNELIASLDVLLRPMDLVLPFSFDHVISRAEDGYGWFGGFETSTVRRLGLVVESRGENEAGGGGSQWPVGDADGARARASVVGSMSGR